MNKFLRVIAHEYGRHALQKRFLFGLLSLPLVVVVMVVTVFVVIALQSDTTPIGYVDRSGFLANPVPPPTPQPPEKPVPMIAYAEEESAKDALDAGEIAAYYVLAEDFPASGRSELIYFEEPKSGAKSQFREFIVANLLAGQSQEVAGRISDGTTMIIRSLDGKRQMSEENWFNALLPIFVALAFFIAITSSAGYLMQAVVDEKENRTMEVMVTSISPNQLMAGKVIGIIGVGLTQLLAWFGFLAAGVLVGSIWLPFLRQVGLPLDTFVILVLVLLPCFVMLSGLMAAAGATVTEAREGQQVAGLFTMPIWIPYFLFGMFINNPNSPVAVILTLFPLTAPMTIILRLGFTVIPTWQLVVSIALLTLSAVGSLWLAGRAFRMGMLMYGQKLPWKRVLGLERRARQERGAA
ncbi:MAG: ABC transporter permease [Chloroflexota bacterium]